MTAVPAVASRSFAVGELVRMRDGSWWLAGGGSTWATYSEEQRLVLVTRSDIGQYGEGFFYGRICSTGEERLWTYEEFELVSSF